MRSIGPSFSRRSLVRIVGSLLFLAIVAALLFVHSARLAMLQENRQLRIELATLSMGENQAPAPHQTARGTSGLSGEQFSELLRLRAEANRLREQQHDLTRLTAENRQMRTNLLATTLEFGGHELNREEIDAYLKRHDRSGQSLLTAFRLTHDISLLQEALKAAPNDPQVLLAAALEPGGSGQRRQRLDALKQAAPNNALAQYLSAQDYFESGQPAQALQELAAANAQTGFDDFSLESFREVEDLFLGMGYPEAAAKAAAWNSRESSSLNSLSKLEKSLRTLGKSYQQSGDDISAGTVLKMGMQLGQRLADDPAQFKTLDHEGLGLAIQRRLLQGLEPAISDGGSTVGDRLARRREELLSTQDPAGWDNYLLKQLSEQNLIGYFDRLKTLGELEARRWAVSQKNN